MNAILRMLDDMDTLVSQSLQELRLLERENSSASKLCGYFTAIGALTSVSGAIAGARTAIKMFSV